MSPVTLSERQENLQARGWHFFSRPERVERLDSQTERTHPAAHRAERLRDDAQGNLQAAGATLLACIESAERTDARMGNSTRIEVQHGP